MPEQGLGPLRVGPLPGRVRLERRFASRTSLGDVGQAREEVIPSHGVARDRFSRQPAVDKTKTRPRSHQLKIDLDRARSGRDHLVSFPAPREDDATVADDLDVLARDDVLRACELHAERAVRPGLELGEPAFPTDVLDRVRQEAEDGLGGASMVITRSMTFVSTAMP